MKRIILYATALFLVKGCSGLAIEEEIMKYYYITAVDVRENASLTYHAPEAEDTWGGQAMAP